MFSLLHVLVRNWIVHLVNLEEAISIGERTNFIITFIFKEMEAFFCFYVLLPLSPQYSWLRYAPGNGSNSSVSFSDAVLSS